MNFQFSSEIENVKRKRKRNSCFFDGFLHARDLLVSRLSATYLRDNLYTSGMHGFRPTFARACLFHSRPAPDSHATVRASTISSNRLAPLYVPLRFIPRMLGGNDIFLNFLPSILPFPPEKLTHICTTLNTTRMINLFLEPLSRNLSTYLDFESRVREGFVNVRKEEEKDLFILGSKCVTIYIETRYFISNWFESLLYSLFLSYSCIRNFIRYLKSVNLFQQFLKFLYKNISIYIYGIIFNASKILKIFNEFLFFSDEKQEIIIIFHFSLV